MALKVYNTLSRKKGIFRPRRGKKVNLFVCGPTTYDFSHIGHARTYIVFDIIVKYLREKGFKVYYLQNITDLDNKIINRAKERKVSPEKLARDFEKKYFEDTTNLKIDSVDKYARATDHIKEIISQVKRLLKKGYAYQVPDGIYYDISKFKDYGKLSRRTALQAEDAVSRIDESKGKRNKGDFCLWKISKPGEPKWKSPWGWGRPGWHIEDTAITEKYFGPQYDIHGGARDLIFPHHEAEIAQMEAISGKRPLVKYWLHSGFLTVKGRKMAKSLGNFITIKDFLKDNPARFLRFLVLKTQYRSPIDYNERLLSQTKKDSDRIAEFVGKLKDIISKKQNISKKSSRVIKDLILNTEKAFESSMDDDFNTPKAIAAIFSLISKGNLLILKNKILPSEAKKILDLLKKIDNIFEIELTRSHYQIALKEELKIKDLIQLREKYRKENQWQKADEIRDKIKKMGYWVEDTKEGPKIKRIS